MSAADIVQRIYELESAARRIEATEPDAARLLRESAAMLLYPNRKPSDSPEARRLRKQRSRQRPTSVEVPEWLRRELIAAAPEACPKCGKEWGDSHSDKPTIDHITPLARGGTNDRSNLRVICGSCNYAGGDAARHDRHAASRESVTSRDSVTSTEHVALGVRQVVEPQEVEAEIIDDVPRDISGDSQNAGAVSETALQLRGAEAAELPNNSTSTHLDTRQASKNTELRRSKAITSSVRENTSLALVTPTRTPSKPPARSVAQITEGIAAVMASVSAGTEQRIAGEKLLRWKAEVAFAYWAKRMGHEQSLLDPQRERRLLTRLRENDGNLHELLYAVDGAFRDDWIMGRDPKAPRKYDGIETVFRDRAQVERLAGLCPKWVRGELHPLAVKYQALMQPDAAAPQPQQEVAHG